MPSLSVLRSGSASIVGKGGVSASTPAILRTLAGSIAGTSSISAYFVEAGTDVSLSASISGKATLPRTVQMAASIVITSDVTIPDQEFD